MIKTCSVCGKEFETKHSTKKYCSEECYKVARRALSKQRKEEYKEARKSQKKICAWCGKEFTPDHRWKKYCSVECQKAVKKATKRIIVDGIVLARPKTSKSSNSLNVALREIREYNEQHGTHLSYGQYQAMKYIGERKNGSI